MFLVKRSVFKIILVIGAVGLGILSFVTYQLNRRQNPLPPGYADWFGSSIWDIDSISYFLGVRIPPDSVALQVEGAQGRRGSYGVMPRLQFSFRAPPKSATTFIASFCNGELHPRYNPLVSIDSSSPSQNSFLIRGAGTIHYSKSPSVSNTIFGNRCDRNGWIEEIVIDKTNPALYLITYRLPYGANVNAEEYYPRAQYITPLGERLRLYVTGLREEKSKDNESLFVLSYPTICLETASLALVTDYWSFHASSLVQYLGATVTITVDGLIQHSARITDFGSLIDTSLNVDKTTSSVRDRWNYCMTADWVLGSHTFQMFVTPFQGSQQVFVWKFEVKPSLVDEPDIN